MTPGLAIKYLHSSSDPVAYLYIVIPFPSPQEDKKNIQLQQHCKQMLLLVSIWTSDLTLGKVTIKVKVTLTSVSKYKLNVLSERNVTANIKLLACRERWWYQCITTPRHLLGFFLLLLKFLTLRSIRLSYILSFPLVPITVRQCVP